MITREEIENAAEEYDKTQWRQSAYRDVSHSESFTAGANYLLPRLKRLEEALHLIAAPKRSDGTYNRCREACEQLAAEALKEE